MALRGKATIRYAVLCSTHGVESKFWAGRSILVSKPKNKRDKMSGCPMCNAQKRKEQP